MLNFILEKLREDKVVFAADEVIKYSVVEIVEMFRECSKLLNDFSPCIHRGGKSVYSVFVILAILRTKKKDTIGMLM